MVDMNKSRIGKSLSKEHGEKLSKATKGVSRGPMKPETKEKYDLPE
jgi:hypothetical protein